jgi:hypothetical protein
LWDAGTFIVASDHPEGRSAWYTFADYFVEVVMKEADFSKAMAEERPMHIAEVVPFYTGPRLERLLSVIDLAKL